MIIPGAMGRQTAVVGQGAQRDPDFEPGAECPEGETRRPDPRATATRAAERRNRTRAARMRRGPDLRKTVDLGTGNVRIRAFTGSFRCWETDVT